mmetsp:Transcript_82655/g.266564  ORF Transcript_82655/g.266564 Transcript_82655/m.266564 type:complete len:775 (+) Transcript_82655:43-2367(+)
MRLVSITRAAMVARCLQVAVAMGLCMPSGGNCVSDACPSPQDVVADGGPLSDEAAALLQHGIRGSDGLGGSSGGSRQASERMGWLTKGLPFKEPPKIRSPFTLTMSTVQLCAPGKGALGGEQCWFTRAYGATHGRIKVAPSVPGPTIFVKPGETPEITLQNDLRWPDPECGALNLGFCRANTTNLHTHGLHVSAQYNFQDDVFVHVMPGEHHTYKIDLPAYHMGGTHWYHPHSHHSAAVQAGGGSFGAIIVEDPKGALPKEFEDMEEKVVMISLIDGSLIINANGVFGQPLLERMAMGHLWRSHGRSVNFPDIAVLVNGLYKPKMTIEDNKWYRFRMVYAAVELVLSIFSGFSEHSTCEMQLLAKDGVYLHEAPRFVDRLYFASGNRVDIAIRCKCVGKPPCSSHLVSAARRPEATPDETRAEVNRDLDAFEKLGEAEHHRAAAPGTGPLAGIEEAICEQDLLHFHITAPAAANHTVSLPLFAVHRPCNLVDLRRVPVPPPNQGRIELMNPIDFRFQYAHQLTGGEAQGWQMKSMNEGPLARLNVGEVYQWYLRGPEGSENDRNGISIHPFHMHVNHFQIVSLEDLGGDSNFYKVGDWADTLMHGSGQAMIKSQTDAFIGSQIFHCHLLDHEDTGMMAHFKVGGKEGAWWHAARLIDPKCYRDLHGVGFKILHHPFHLKVQPRFVLSKPGSNCHAACADHGGCQGRLPLGTGEEFHSVLRTMGVACSSVTESADEHAPSMLHGGACVQRKAAAATGHCGTIAKGVIRFCRCGGM